MQFSQAMIALAATLTWTAVGAAPVAEPKSANLVRRQGEAGYWQVKNECSFTVYYTSVNQQGTVVDNGYVEPGTTTSGSFAPDQDGLSVKLCDVANCGDPYQFETTVALSSNQVFYDLSAVNGDPFINYKRGVYPSDNSGPNLECDPGSESCAYGYSTDDTKTTAASDSAVIIAQIC